MASLPLEGKLHADGLQAMDSDDISQLTGQTGLFVLATK